MVCSRAPQVFNHINTPPLRFHDLKHSAASLLVAEENSLKQIGAYLGHSNPATTNRYAHVDYVTTAKMVDSVAAKVLVSEDKGSVSKCDL